MKKIAENLPDLEKNELDFNNLDNLRYEVNIFAIFAAMAVVFTSKNIKFVESMNV